MKEVAKTQSKKWLWLLIAFTEANSNAASFLNYFKAFTSGKTVKEENGQLMIG